MIETFPKAFTDYIQDVFGLEWVDYNNRLCYEEWCTMHYAEIDN